MILLNLDTYIAFLARHCLKPFTLINSRNSHGNPSSGSHFIDEKTKAQRGSVTYPRSHSVKVGELDRGPGACLWSLPLLPLPTVSPSWLSSSQGEGFVCVGHCCTPTP